MINHCTSDTASPGFRRVFHASYVLALVSHAWDRGARHVSPSLWEWDVAGDCHVPAVCELEGRYDTPVRMVERDPWADASWEKLGIVWADGKFQFADLIRQKTPIVLQLHMRCRKCAACLRARARLWRERAERETRNAQRTWFGTLTLSPEWHFRLEMQTLGRLQGKAVDLRQLSASEQFREKNTEIFAEITKWLKRVRKESAATLRYCLVVELHKSGLPHYHALIHEVPNEGTVGERTLRKQWKLGHSSFKLVRAEENAARYVTKYLTKQALARVRASIRYGEDDSDDFAICQRQVVDLADWLPLDPPPPHPPRRATARRGGRLSYPGGLD